MTVIIDGTSGIDNDATDLSYTGTLTGGTGVVNLGSGQVYKDALGNLGLGVTPGSTSASGTFQMKAGGDMSFLGNGNISSNTYYNGTNYIYATTAASTRYRMAAGQHEWYNAPSGTAGNAISFTQAMTLDSSGHVLFGCTSLPSSSVAGSGFEKSTNGRMIIKASSTVTTSTNLALFYNPNGNIGSIQTSGSSTSYATSSDYRLKENITPMTGALAKVALLKPCTYTWKVDGSGGQGFIAHELDEVVPGCVSGEKDAVDADGKPQYQGIDTSFLVATLTAALQELKAIVDAQGAEITALTTRSTALEERLSALEAA